MVLLWSSPSAAEIAASPNPLTAIVLVVVDAILEVFFLCAVGWIMAWQGLVDDKVKKVLNKMNVNLFTPALLFGKVAFALSPDKLFELFIIPIGFVLISCISAATAFVLGSIFRLKKGQRNFAIACAMFQNSNSLPIALMQSLVGEAMPLQWGPDDDEDQMLGRALSYLVLFSTLGIIVRWSIGVRLLTSAEDDREYFDEIPGEDAEAQVTPGEHPQDPELSLGPQIVGNGNGLSTAAGETPKRKGSAIPSSYPNTPGNVSLASGPSSDSESPDDDGDEWGAPRGFGRRNAAQNGKWAKFKRATKVVWKPLQRFGHGVLNFMTVPLWAALLSLFVACVPPLQKGLHSVEPLTAAIRNTGNCSVPITLVTLGAYFYRPKAPTARHAKPTLLRKALQKLNPLYWINGEAAEGRSHEEENLLEREECEAEERETARRQPPAGESRTVFVAVFSRMVLVPLMVVPLFYLYVKYTTNVADDPVFVVVACLLIGSPTAITLAQLTSSTGSDVFEKLISKTLFVSYAIMTAPTTIALSLAALYISDHQ